jgi:hypothetical protein
MGRCRRHPYPLFRAGTERPLALVHGETAGDASGGANEEDFDRTSPILLANSA